jgi:hypothetical protein
MPPIRPGSHCRTASHLERRYAQRADQDDDQEDEDHDEWPKTVGGAQPTQAEMINLLIW